MKNPAASATNSRGFSVNDLCNWQMNAILLKGIARSVRGNNTYVYEKKLISEKESPSFGFESRYALYILIRIRCERFRIRN